MRAPRAPRARGARPELFFVGSAVFHYLGPSFAVLLFARVEPLGVAWLRILTAGVVFAVWRRPWRAWSSAASRERLTVLGWGVVLAVMNASFYLAIDLLPLGTVAAIEFAGPILLAVVGARGPRDLAAVGLAAAGVAVLAEISLAGSPTGFAFAIANMVLFSGYIIAAHRVSRHQYLAGIDGLAAAMLIAAVVALPIGIADAAPAFTDLTGLAAAVGVGMSSSVIPYVLDQFAMRRLARATYALMVALLPATATVVGILVLAQLPTPTDLLGVGLIIAAVALHQDRQRRVPPERGNRPDTLAEPRGRTDHPGRSPGQKPTRDVPGRRRLVGACRDRRSTISTWASPTAKARHTTRGERRGTVIDHVRLGATGLSVSRLALGMMSYGDQSRRSWVLDEDAAEPIVRAAVEGGITFFDTADMYAGGASEVVTGRLVRKLLTREEAVVATKVYYPTTAGPNGRGLSRKHIMAAIDASLTRLEMDYVDLYQIHRFDPHTPIDETMEALHDVVRAGKARYLGASTMPAWRFAKAQTAAALRGRTRFVAMQNRYNLLDREDEREMIPLCLDQGVAVIPYSPLARGFLAGTRTRDGGRATARAAADPVQDDLYGRPEDFGVIDRVVQVATRRGVPPAQVALAWLLRQPAVTAPIVGATRVEHVHDALAATDMRLSDEELASLDAAYRSHPIPDRAAVDGSR